MNLELRHLKVLCVIADTGSVTKAASHLGLAQPNVTAQLHRIERTLGGRLFERDRHGVRPTALGDLVLARARVLLPAVKGLQDEAARLTGEASRDPMSRYRIGASGGPIVGGMVRRISDAQPLAQIITHASFSQDELVTMLIEERLDYAQIGICGNAVAPGQTLRWQTVALDAVCVMLLEDHPAAKDLDVDLADLAEEQWVAAPGDSCFGDCFAAACARSGFTPRRILESDVRAYVDMVESGAAVGICQPTFRPPAGLTVRPLRGAPLLWRSLVGWLPGSPAAGCAPQMLGLAQEAYREVLARNPAYSAWVRDYPQLAGGLLTTDTSAPD